MIDKIEVSYQWNEVKMVFLKKMKIDGFKSFAKPIVINFESPLTTIVGPNGSGKSNILDAYRWVLGEQSAKSLRGSRMSDIIFAGSDHYKPLHKASVTLYLDNTAQILPLESGEVRICRRVTDSGQSDYSINGRSCRLKDIEELFLDTSIGRDAYSVVSQGEIETILNSKPEKLRVFFEKAAGISKHKLRREEAAKRLEKTRLNLQRVQDLVWELENQLTPLEKAAEKTRKYLHLKEELEVLAINLFLEDWERNRKNLAKAEAKKKLLEKGLAQAEAELEAAENKVQAEQKKLEQEQEISEVLQESYYNLKAKSEETTSNLKVLKERNNSLLREKGVLEEQIGDELETKGKLIAIGDQVAVTLLENKEHEAGIDRKLTEKSELLVEKRKLLQERKEKLFLRRNSVMGENIELTDVQAELEKLRGKNHYLESGLDKLLLKKKEVVVELEHKLLGQDDLEQSLNSLEQESKSVCMQLNQLKEQQIILENEINRTQEEQAGINSKLNKNQSRLTVLQEMEEEYQGYFRGVRSILPQKADFSGLIGVVADLIKVEEKYELAIETALGSRLQHVVVEDDDTARQCVKYLKDNKGGRATFLPLNLVKGRESRPEQRGISQLSGYLGQAANFVKFDQTLQPVIDYLLGRTLMVSSLKEATAIAKYSNAVYKIVTLEGELISPGGAITGGSQTGTNKGLLSRSREIKELKRAITSFAQTREQLVRNEKEKRADLADNLALIAEQRERLAQLDLDKKAVNNEIDNLKREQVALDRELAGINQDFLEYHQQLEDNDQEIARLEQRIELINNEYFKEKDQIEQMEEDIKLLEQQEEIFNTELTELKIALATIRQKKDGLLKEREGINSRLENSNNKMEELHQQLDHVEETIAKIGEREKHLIERCEYFTADAEKAREDYQQKSKQIKDKQQQLEQLREQMAQSQQTINDLKEKNHQQDLKVTRLEDKLEQLGEKLSGEYGVDPRQGYHHKIKIENYQLVKQKINEFKQAMEGLEPVNPGAIDEHRELKKRLDYLIEQQADLLKAEDSIITVIEEIEKNMSQQFYNTFSEVKGHFEKIFGQLFNGGKAELSLTSPANLLETGVEIEAQPPGKQLKKLTLMSGGERALTAIALVFAFLKVNPSPVYILDEIDASLDDANVIRFARFVKEYSNTVQFLIITHNKSMMMEANIIYGITMEEPGISKLVSLRLDEEIA
ncbi:MAG: chromosome segregation protein SMC [Halanaerobiales bacterium]|nr:chromosome segregation protein SMC [Halanaerobiales bacterium]